MQLEKHVACLYPTKPSCDNSMYRY